MSYLVLKIYIFPVLVDFNIFLYGLLIYIMYIFIVFFFINIRIVKKFQNLNPPC